MLIPTPNFFLSLLLISSLFCPTLLAKSSHPISDFEVRKNKMQCYADIDGYADIYSQVHLVLLFLWVVGLVVQIISDSKENCALRCLSPACYELIYESDPLEEGEKDLTRSQEYKYCMHKSSLGESLEGVKGAFSN
ncbi:hypothetical protein ACSQ67_020756 [Phaseolus vulgaris]